MFDVCCPLSGVRQFDICAPVKGAPSGGGCMATSQRQQPQQQRRQLHGGSVSAEAKPLQEVVESWLAVLAAALSASAASSAP